MVVVGMDSHFAKELDGFSASVSAPKNRAISLSRSHPDDSEASKVNQKSSFPLQF